MMHKVDSSSIAEVGHDGKGLLVKFHNGSIYRYDTVSPQSADTLRLANSVGSHFNKYISGKHNGVKVA